MRDKEREREREREREKREGERERERDCIPILHGKHYPLKFFLEAVYFSHLLIHITISNIFDTL
jgi:hypothetical protein